MRGFPKRLSSKADYLYIKEHFPAEQWKPEWQALLDTMSDWFAVGNVASVEAGKTDATHRVETFDDDNGKVTYTQYEYKANPDCKLLRLGFTEAEVRAALK